MPGQHHHPFSPQSPPRHSYHYKQKNKQKHLDTRHSHYPHYTHKHPNTRFPWYQQRRPQKDPAPEQNRDRRTHNSSMYPQHILPPSSPKRTRPRLGPPEPIKVHLLGPPSSGKTCFATQYLFGHYTALHIPTLHALYSATVPVYSSDPSPYINHVLYPRGPLGFQIQRDLVLNVTDHGGGGRPGTHVGLEGAEVVVVCVSLVEKGGLGWWRDLGDLTGEGRRKVVLVGTKKDLRSAFVTVETAASVILQGDLIRAVQREGQGWIFGGECSAVTEWGMKEVWWNIVDAALKTRNQRVMGKVKEIEGKKRI